MPASTAPTASPIPIASISSHNHKLSSLFPTSDNPSHKSTKEILFSSSNQDHEITKGTPPNTDKDIFIPEGLPLSKVCAIADARVQHFLDEQTQDKRLKVVQGQARKSLNIIEEALERYSLPELSLSYNGGKDCLVLLILYLCAIHRKSALVSQPQQQQHPSRSQHQAQAQAQCRERERDREQQQEHGTSSTPNTDSSSTSTSTSNVTTHLQSVYIQAAHPFPSVEHFVTHTSALYNLKLTRLRPPMKSGFAAYLASNPAISAIFVGTRRTDPHGSSLKPFQRTDHGWPDFERIHPVLEWRYVEIWTFIRHLRIPYCPLYDAGYTSLGGTDDTYPNPALRIDLSLFSSTEERDDHDNKNNNKKYKYTDDIDIDDNKNNNDKRRNVTTNGTTNTTMATNTTTPSSSSRSSTITATPDPNIQRTTTTTINNQKNIKNHNQNTDIDKNDINNDHNNISSDDKSISTHEYKPAYDLQDDALERLGRRDHP